MEMSHNNYYKEFFSSLYKKAHYVFVVVALIMGLFVSLYSSPFDIPDEDTHWLKAYSISTMQFSSIDGYNTNLPTNVVEFQYKVYNTDYSNISDAHLLNDIKDYQKGNQFINFRTAGINPLMQLAPATGIFVTSIFTDSVLYQFIGGRIMNLLVYVLIVFLAIKHSPKFKWAMTSIALLPMCILLAASYSYDALIIACSISLFSSFCSMHYKDEKVSKLDIGIFIASSAVMIVGKMVYAPLVGIILLVDKNKFKYAFGKYIVAVMAGLAGLIIYYGWAKFGYVTTNLFNSHLIAQYREQMSVATDLGVPTGISIMSDIKDFISNPLFYIRSFFATFGYYGKMYIPAAVAISYGMSINYTTAFIVLLLFFSICIFEYDGEKMEWLSLGYRLLIFIACTFLIFLALYSYLPPDNSGQLVTEFIRGAGIQGRYFLPCALLLIVGIPINFVKQYHKQLITLSLFGLFVIQCTTILMKLA